MNKERIAYYYKMLHINLIDPDLYSYIASPYITTDLFLSCCEHLKSRLKSFFFCALWNTISVFGIPRICVEHRLFLLLSFGSWKKVHIYHNCSILLWIYHLLTIWSAIDGYIITFLFCSVPCLIHNYSILLNKLFSSGVIRSKRRASKC